MTMTNLINERALNSIQNELNYKSVKRGMSSGNLANFSNLRRCKLAGNSLFQGFFAAFSMLAWTLLISKILKKIRDMKGKKVYDLTWNGLYIFIYLLTYIGRFMGSHTLFSVNLLNFFLFLVIRNTRYWILNQKSLPLKMS